MHVWGEAGTPDHPHRVGWAPIPHRRATEDDLLVRLPRASRPVPEPSVAILGCRTEYSTTGAAFAVRRVKEFDQDIMA